MAFCKSLAQHLVKRTIAIQHTQIGLRETELADLNSITSTRRIMNNHTSEGPRPSAHLLPHPRLNSSLRDIWNDTAVPQPAAPSPDTPISQVVERPGTPFISMLNEILSEADLPSFSALYRPSRLVPHWSQEPLPEYLEAVQYWCANDGEWPPYDDAEPEDENNDGAEESPLNTYEDLDPNSVQASVLRFLSIYVEDAFDAHYAAQRTLAMRMELTRRIMQMIFDIFYPAHPFEEIDWAAIVFNPYAQRYIWEIGLEAALWYARWRDGQICGHLDLKARMLGRGFSCDSCVSENADGA